jgi:hypothetical protein
MSYSKEYLQFFINTFNDFGWEKSEHSTDEIIIFHAPHKGYSYAAVTINTSEFLKDGSYINGAREEDLFTSINNIVSPIKTKRVL